MVKWFACGVSLFSLKKRRVVNNLWPASVNLAKHRFRIDSAHLKNCRLEIVTFSISFYEVEDRCTCNFNVFLASNSSSVRLFGAKLGRQCFVLFGK